MTDTSGTAAPAAENAPADDGSISVPLEKPIQVFADKVTVLKFRKPTAADIIQLGNPVIFDPFSDLPKLTHDARIMTAMMARLAGVPSSSIGFLEPRDWVSCAWALSPFFMPIPGKI